MFFRIMMNHVKLLLKTKEAMVTFFILLLIVLSNFLSNINMLQGRDITELYHPMKMLSLSYNKSLYDADTALLLIQLYPFLVILPGGFSYIKENQTREEVYLVSRIGKGMYFFNRLFATFFCTAIVFTIPFIIEIFLNCVSFPLSAMGDYTNMSIYDAEYLNMVKNYLGSSIYIVSPVVYAILATIFFGIISGMLSTFVVGISFIFKVKYRVILLLPVYFILNATMYMEKFLPNNAYAISWYHYVFLFDSVTKTVLYLLFFLVALVAISVISGMIRMKGDVL